MPLLSIIFTQYAVENMLCCISEASDIEGKPMIPHLRRCQGFAAAYYGFTLDVLNPRHPRLSLN
jgi:hypothetical protein